MGTLLQPFARIPVPEDLRRLLVVIILACGRKKAVARLGCSHSTLDDALCMGATLRPATLERLRAAATALAADIQEGAP